MLSVNILKCNLLSVAFVSNSTNTNISCYAQMNYSSVGRLYSLPAELMYPCGLCVSVLLFTQVSISSTHDSAAFPSPAVTSLCNAVFGAPAQ